MPHPALTAALTAGVAGVGGWPLCVRVCAPAQLEARERTATQEQARLHAAAVPGGEGGGGEGEGVEGGSEGDEVSIGAASEVSAASGASEDEASGASAAAAAGVRQRALHHERGIECAEGPSENSQ